MKKKTLLKKIEELNKKITELQDQVRDLQSRPAQIIREYPQQPPIYIPSIWSSPMCPKGGQCEYPAIWHGTVPPPCSKCGQSQAQPYTITCTAMSSGAPDLKSLDAFLEDMDRRKIELSSTLYHKSK